jgi:DNA polymerase alpha-associated DNA helicase A
MKLETTCPGTGKTHILVEIIRQLLFGPPGSHNRESPARKIKLLVCGASNLSVDNILERILKLPKDKHGEIKSIRIGHPARVMSTDTVLNATLDAQVSRSDQASHIFILCQDRV